MKDETQFLVSVGTLCVRTCTIAARNLQNTLRDLGRARIGLMVRVQVRVRVGFGQKIANYACAISKSRGAFCKLRRLANRAQHNNYNGLPCAGTEARTIMCV